MTAQEQRRAMAVTQVLAGRWAMAEAAETLGLSLRHMRRLLRAYERDGPAGLVHGNRGRPAPNRVPDALRAQVVALAQGRYAGFNQQHFTEQLADHEGLALSRMSVRRILHAAGIVSPRRRRAAPPRSRRERRAQAGMLLQADGSRHEWLGPGNGYLTLIGGIDDATGTVPWALFRAQEDAAGYMAWLQHVVETDGIPQALYVDRHGIFQRSPSQRLSREEEFSGTTQPTQFGRVLAELGITPIYAQSPQAKGRVERLWDTFQDRLVSELRAAGAQTAAEADVVLVRFLEDFNRRFAVPAAQPGSAYRPLPAGFVAAQVFCFKYQRVVAADNTVQFGQERLQLLAGPRRVSYARATVEVHERLDGSVAVYLAGQCVATREAPADAPILRARRRRLVSAGSPGDSQPPSSPAPEPARTAPSLREGAGTAGRRQPLNHPWRRPWLPKDRTESLVT